MSEDTGAALCRSLGNVEELLRKEVQAAILDLKRASAAERGQAEERLDQATRRLTQYILCGGTGTK